jgi:hypothetical protein
MVLLSQKIKPNVDRDSILKIQCGDNVGAASQSAHI